MMWFVFDAVGLLLFDFWGIGEGPRTLSVIRGGSIRCVFKGAIRTGWPSSVG